MTTTLVAGQRLTIGLPAQRALTAIGNSLASARVWRLGDSVGDAAQGYTAVGVSETVIVGPFATATRFEVECLAGSVTFGDAAVDYPTLTEVQSDVSERSVDYAETGHSYQVFAADLNLDNAAGSDDGEDPKFLAAMMGNIFGSAIAGEGNYIIGLIGAYSVEAHSSDYPTAGVAGVIMDGSTGADGIVLAVIDGSDPSSVTRAKSAFGVRMLNNNAGSGVDYGLDLKDDGSPHYTGTGEPFTVDKAEMRFSKGDVVEIVDAGVPVDYTDGTPPATGEGYAGPGSRYTDITGKVIYLNTGTKAHPIWSALAFSIV